MLKIKFVQIGKKKIPYYKIILYKKYHSKYIIKFGYYNPITKIIYINKNFLNKYIKIGSYITNRLRHCIFKYLKYIYRI
jgi:ribosomal protein S16